ncbi:hypothetical protein EGW08_010829, partial [Elysia chlorotica]
LSTSSGELRCHCNESGCVATGYMCKSQAGQCYTALEVRGEDTHLTHGCLDSLPSHHRALCQRVADPAGPSAGATASRLAGDGDPQGGDSSAPTLLCCTEHMCNYREDTDIGVNLMPKHNSTYRRGGLAKINEGSVYARDHHSARRRDDEADRDLWFKAAVIAVPIAGGFILVLLVLLAVRMLRSDSTRHRRLIQIRRERSLTKAQMYISEHFMGGAGTSTSIGVKNKLQHSSLFSEKPQQHPHRESYSIYSEKIPASSAALTVSSARAASNHGGGSVTAPRGSSDNSNVFSSTGSSICKNSSNASSSGGHNNTGGFTSDICCTDERPCCGGLCSVQRETQTRHCEACNNKRRSLSSFNTTYCRCSKTCHSNPSDCASSPKSTSAIKTPISSSSNSEEDLSAGRQPKSSSHARHSPCSFSTDSPPIINPGGGVLSTDKYSEIPAHLNSAPSNNCDHNQYRTVVAHWDKTNPRAPTALL